jgi:hypothetical protein
VDATRCGSAARCSQRRVFELRGAAAAESQGCLSPRLHPMPASDEFLTVAEIAAELKMNQQSIRDWI